jgi:outer membrane lipoprotein-sorting protein
MSDLPITSEAPVALAPRSPQIVALGPETPDLEELFVFMRDAELRVESLRMRIVDRTAAATGEAHEVLEAWLRHPGRAKVITRRSEGDGSLALSRDYQVWLTDGEAVRTFDSASKATTVRPVRARPVGITDPGLPSYARVYVPLTALPMETLADTFVHPHGFCRNVLATARLRILGATTLGDREAYLLRADHPRTTLVLTDRPDRWLDIAVDRATGFILLLVEHVGDRVTRDAEVTDLELDPPFPDDVFRLHLSEGVRTLY